LDDECGIAGRQKTRWWIAVHHGLAHPGSPAIRSLVGRAIGDLILPVPRLWYVSSGGVDDLRRRLTGIRSIMRLRLLGCGLVCLIFYRAAAEPVDEIETLEATAAAHVAAFSTLAAERTNLALRYRALIETLTQRLKFGTVPKNPALIKDLQEAQKALAALGDTAEPLGTLSAELTDDAAAANALARTLRAALAAP